MGQLDGGGFGGHVVISLELNADKTRVEFRVSESVFFCSREWVEPCGVRAEDGWKRGRPAASRVVIRATREAYSRGGQI